MPRRPREEEAGAVWHVYARGNGRQDIFITDDDRQLYLRLLGKTVTKHRWACMAYCLMSNHLHLLLETPDPNLGIGMQRLQSVYAQTLNEIHGWSGHVFQGRYGAERIKTEEQLWVTARYIARNPVEAGLCAEPDEWRWSSHAAVAGTRTMPAWLDLERLLGYFATRGGVPRSQYLKFVAG
jgi:REP-associated tyrosine transposase